jgi:hypothetical protein
MYNPQVVGIMSGMETVMESQAIPLMIGDDHVIVRKGIRALVRGQEGILVIGKSANGNPAAQLVNQVIDS